MASDLRPTAQAIAQAFHEAYEELAPAFGYETRRDSAVPWDQVPENNRHLMMATVERVLERMAVPIGAAMYDTDGWHVALNAMVAAPAVVRDGGPPPLGAPVMILSEVRTAGGPPAAEAEPVSFETERRILQGALDSAWLRMTRERDGTTGDWYAGRYLPVIGDFGAAVEVDIYPWWASIDEDGTARGFSNGPNVPGAPERAPTWGWRFNVGWDDFEDDRDHRALLERMEDLGGSFDDRHVDFIGEPVETFNVKPSVTDAVAEAYHICLSLDR